MLPTYFAHNGVVHDEPHSLIDKLIPMIIVVVVFLVIITVTIILARTISKKKAATSKVAPKNNAKK